MLVETLLLALAQLLHPLLFFVWPQSSRLDDTSVLPGDMPSLFLLSLPLLSSAPLLPLFLFTVLPPSLLAQTGPEAKLRSLD